MLESRLIHKSNLYSSLHDKGAATVYTGKFLLHDFAATQFAGQVFNVSCNLGDRYKNLQHKLQKDDTLNRT